MNRRPLWPLLPPLVVSGAAALFLGVTKWTSSEIATGCYIRETTGINCPGCGGTRCAHDLAAGNWLSALDHHALFTVGIFIFAVISLYLIVRITILGKPAPRLPNISTTWIWISLALLALFTVLRNIPSWPFNLLAP